MRGSLSTSVSYLIRFAMLVIGFAMATYGLVAWAGRDFDMAGVWLYDNGWRAHPLHGVILGLGLIPPAMWELFLLELARSRRERRRLARERAAAAHEAATGSEAAESGGDG